MIKVWKLLICWSKTGKQRKYPCWYSNAMICLNWRIIVCIDTYSTADGETEELYCSSFHLTEALHWRSWRPCSNASPRSGPTSPSRCVGWSQCSLTLTKPRLWSSSWGHHTSSGSREPPSLAPSRHCPEFSEVISLKHLYHQQFWLLSCSRRFGDRMTGSWKCIH